MNNLPLTSTFASLFTLFYLFLSFRIGYFRGSPVMKLIFKMGEEIPETKLQRNVRAHGNFSEYVPFFGSFTDHRNSRTIFFCLFTDDLFDLFIWETSTRNLFRVLCLKPIFDNFGNVMLLSGSGNIRSPITFGGNPRIICSIPSHLSPMV